MENLLYKEIVKNASRKLNLIMEDLLELVNIIKQLENGMLEASRELAEMTTEMHEVSK